MSVEEYLKTSFEGADCDFVDGQVIERNMGEALHGDLQGLLYELLRQQQGRKLRVIPEIRVQINMERYRVADLAVWLPGTFVGREIPPHPPFLAVEILSPEDRITRVIPRINDYLSKGVQYAWLIDPYEGSAMIYSQAEPTGRLTDVLYTEDPRIEIPLADLMARLPQE
jgi:Uma2 family endonuclease